MRLIMFRLTCGLLVLSGALGLCTSIVAIAADEPKKSEPVLASTPETASPLRFTTSSADYATLTIAAAPTNLVFHTPKGQLVIDLKDGSVKIPEGMTMDEASREFWLTLAKALPYVRHQLIYGEEKKP